MMVIKSSESKENDDAKNSIDPSTIKQIQIVVK